MPKGERMREQPYPAATQMRTLVEDHQSFGSSAKRRKLYHIPDFGSMILCCVAPLQASRRRLRDTHGGGGNYTPVKKKLIVVS